MHRKKKAISSRRDACSAPKVAIVLTGDEFLDEEIFYVMKKNLGVGGTLASPFTIPSVILFTALH
jgi:hypothetical protein